MIFAPEPSGGMRLGEMCVFGTGRSYHGRSYLASLMAQVAMGTRGILMHDVEMRGTYPDLMIFDECHDLFPRTVYGSKPKADWKQTVLERQGKKNNVAPSSLLMKMMGNLE